MELRVPGALGNVHWFAFATPYRPGNELGQTPINWGELLAIVRGSPQIELRIVDRRGRVHHAALLEGGLVEEARLAAAGAQALMIGLARDFQTRCRPYDGDPYNRDIIVL